MGHVWGAQMLFEYKSTVNEIWDLLILEIEYICNFVLLWTFKHTDSFMNVFGFKIWMQT
jgi:hypothetical protein